MNLVVVLCLLFPELAFSASVEGTLQSLVNAFVGRILPILALAYLGKNIFGHIQGDMNAKQDTARVVIAIALLLGINGVWAFIQGQVK